MGQDRWSGIAQKHYNDKAKLKREKRRYKKFVKSYQKIEKILNITKENTLLDVGCGAGELAKSLENKIVDYYGVDISDTSLAIAKEINPHKKFINADMTSLPFSMQFDFITALSSLEFCHDKKLALREFHRLLKKTGKLYIEVRNQNFIIYKIFSPFIKYFVKLKLIIPYEAEGFRDLSFDEWNKLLYEAGFEIINIKKSIRPTLYGNFMTQTKNILIKLVQYITPIKYQYMVGFLCKKR